MVKKIESILFHKVFLTLLFFINLAGSIYGYIWYGPQLATTELIYYLFVPDSPTATLFFTIAILGWLFNRHFRLFEALAFISNLKYGIWAVVMNLFAMQQMGELSLVGWMLICSHALMAIQVLLYWKKYDFVYGVLAIAAIWTLHNEMIDYVFGQMPQYSMLTQFMPQIGYFTFWLSILCIFIAYICAKRTYQLRRQTITTYN